MQALLSLRQKARRLAARLCPGVLTDDLTLLRNSGYFDPFWYRQNNPDVTARDADPLRHYLLYGGLEGRSPGPKFDSLGYLESNPDVRAAGVNPLVHYLEFGRAEGRSPCGAAREAELKADIRAIQEDYIRRFGNPIDFRAPTRFMEKLQIYKLVFRNPIMHILADKAAAKKFVGDIIGSTYIVPLIGVYDRFADIPRDKLPSQFVIKANHGSGFTIICRDKDSFDWEKAAWEADGWMQYDYYGRFREWCYKGNRPKLVVEELLVDEGGGIPPDCKIHVTNGKVCEVQYIYNRFEERNTSIHMMPEWERLQYSINVPPHIGFTERPPQTDLMMELAEKLGRGFPFVRVDFFLCKGRVYFAEMTFYPRTGFGILSPGEWDRRLAERVVLEGRYDREYFGRLSDEVFREMALTPELAQTPAAPAQLSTGESEPPAPVGTMNALIFTHSSGLGGAERSLVELVRELSSYYHTRCTVVLPGVGALESELQKAGARTIIAPTSWWCALSQEELDRNPANLAFTGSWLRENIQMLKDLHPDVILTNTMVLPWGAAAAFLLDKPHIWLVNEFGVLDHGLLFQLGLEKSLEFIAQSSECVLTRSKAIQNVLFPGMNPPKVETVYRYIPPPTAEDLIADSDAPGFQNPQAFKLLLAGTISEGKGQADAVRALKILREHGLGPLELLMPGGAHQEFKARLETLIQSFGLEGIARILPFQQRMPALTNQADAVLVCSRMEGLGRVSLEAMQLKKPVIASASGGSPEMITDGETGLLYPVGDIPALAERIERLMKDPDLRVRLGENGFHFARTRFSEEQFGGRINDIMRGLNAREITWTKALDASLEALTGSEFTSFVRRTIAVHKTLKTPQEIC
jgi:glycosyltransferase involved in cell wall biosynthesis